MYYRLKIPIEWCEKEVTLDEAERQVAAAMNKKIILLPGLSPELHAKYRAALEILRAKSDQERMQQWLNMKALIGPEDTLRKFSTPLEDWRNRSGVCGIALVRSGEVISYVALISD